MSSELCEQIEEHPQPCFAVKEEISCNSEQDQDESEVYLKKDRNKALQSGDEKYDSDGLKMCEMHRRNVFRICCQQKEVERNIPPCFEEGFT